MQHLTTLELGGGGGDKVPNSIQLMPSKYYLGNCTNIYVCFFCIYFCNVYLIHICIHVNVFLVIVHVQYYVNPNSAMSILHDGMCALEESTIIIIITVNLAFRSRTRISRIIA